MILYYFSHHSMLSSKLIQLYEHTVRDYEKDCFPTVFDVIYDICYYVNTLFVCQ